VNYNSYEITVKGVIGGAVALTFNDRGMRKGNVTLGNEETEKISGDWGKIGEDEVGIIFNGSAIERWRCGKELFDTRIGHAGYNRMDG
jgi:hypothetical protein